MTDLNDEIERIRARLAECDEGAPCTITQDYELDYDPDEYLDTEVRCAVADIRALLAALVEARAESATLRAVLDRTAAQRDEAEQQRDRERVRAAEWQAVARDSEAARARLVEYADKVWRDSEAARAERDRARREAIEECIAAVEERRDTSDGHYAAIGAYGRALAVMRALLAPTPDTRT